MKNANELPQYLRIADELRDRLVKMPVGAPFETEQTLSREYGVSRGTVRHALDVLEREGLLVRTQGRGSCRAQPSKSPFALLLSGSLSEYIRTVGSAGELKHLSISTVKAPCEIADMLCIPHGSKVRRVSRLRALNGAPIAYGTAYLRIDLVPQFYKRDYRAALNTLVREQLHLHIGSHTCEICASEADPVVADALLVPPSSPVLKLCFCCRDLHDVPLLVDTFCFPPSQTLQLEAVRSQTPGAGR